MTRVVFVCLGNICRSPTAEAVFASLVAGRRVADRYVIDSAGTSDWHRGELADPRTRACADGHGVAITHRARQFVAADFERFDHVIVMDRKNQTDVLALATNDRQRAKVALFRSFEAEADGDEVPDPWYSGEFERVFAICRRASLGLFDVLERARRDGSD